MKDISTGNYQSPSRQRGPQLSERGDRKQGSLINISSKGSAPILQSDEPKGINVKIKRIPEADRSFSSKNNDPVLTLDQA